MMDTSSDDLPSFTQENEELYNNKYNNNQHDDTPPSTAPPPPPTTAAAKTTKLPWNVKGDAYVTPAKPTEEDIANHNYYNNYAQSTRYSATRNLPHLPHSPNPNPAVPGASKLPWNYNKVAYITSAEPTTEKAEEIPKNYYAQSTITKSPPPPHTTAAAAKTRKLPWNYNEYAYITSAEPTAEKEEEIPNYYAQSTRGGGTTTEIRETPPLNLPSYNSNYYRQKETEDDERSAAVAKSNKYYYYKNYFQNKQQPQGMSDNRYGPNKKYFTKTNNYDDPTAANIFDDEDDLP
ncbi:unnamed protein product [Cuscuta campestris]|uniref:Uncharacterized protein n=1 Tax=Cuscuta campestris TaxID=132261 RepID=A0A484LYJ8_9ASTE|nr:unnamed protein product [Cuscuta campestris]